MSETSNSFLFYECLTEDNKPFDLAESTDLAVATYLSLGLSKDKGHSKELIGSHMAALHERLTGNFPEVGVEPFYTINEGIGFRELVSAFDNKQKRASDIYEPLWNQYDDKAFRVRRVGEAVLGGSTEVMISQARAMVLGGNIDEPGLYCTGWSYWDQLKLAGAEQLMNPYDYIMFLAQRREAGSPMLDNIIYSTRFPQIKIKVADGKPGFPGAGTFKSKLTLIMGHGVATPHAGVRILVD